MTIPIHTREEVNCLYLHQGLTTIAPSHFNSKQGVQPPLRQLFIHSFILETYIAPLQETTTQRRSQSSHGQKRRTLERCNIWKGGPSARNAAQRGDHSTLMDPQSKRPFTA